MRLLCFDFPIFLRQGKPPDLPATTKVAHNSSLLVYSNFTYPLGLATLSEVTCYAALASPAPGTPASLCKLGHGPSYTI